MAIPHHRNPTNFFRDGQPVGEMRGFAAGIVVDEAIGWLDRRQAAAPFFLYLAIAEPHSTIANPDRFNAQYAAHTDGTPDPMANADVPPANIASRGPGEYYGNVSHMDFQVGRFLEYLDAHGLRENTVDDLDAHRFEVIDHAPTEPAVVQRLVGLLRERHASVAGDPLGPPSPPATLPRSPNN